MTGPGEREAESQHDGAGARDDADSRAPMGGGLGPVAAMVLRAVERHGWRLSAACGIAAFLIIMLALAGVARLALHLGGWPAGAAPVLIACAASAIVSPAIIVGLRMVEHLCGLRDRLEDEVERRSTAEQRLIRLVGEDELTGLANRRQFAWQARAALAMARRYRQSVSLLMIDIDRFKEVNDREGHAAGDQALVRVAQILRLILRETDTAARHGGDEFVVLLPHTGMEAAMVVAERIREAVAAEPGPPALTVSIGCATAEGGRLPHPQLQRLADQAMYAAKAAGRNRVQASGRGSAIASRLDLTAS
ncbi:MAG: GGDEF domain-containing protein [Geminicoccaceae bacterium]